MSHSPDAEDFVVAEWRAALADAAVSEDDFHLITCPGAPVTGFVKAVSFDPGGVLYGDDEEGGVVVQPDKLVEANADANLWRHRVGILEDVEEDEIDLARLAGLLRHEIEHGKQREVAGEAFGLYDVTALVAQLVAGGDSDRKRDIFHASPIEADADAGAAAHVRKRYPNAVAALLNGPDKYLVQATAPPGDPRTLVERTVDYLWQYRDVCDDPKHLPQGRTFADILDNRVPGTGAGDRWRVLREEQPRG